MKEVSDITVLVHDCGLFLPFASRMAEKCARVIWYNPDRRPFPSVHQGAIGDGFDGIEHTFDFWPMLDEIDLFCFPDIHHSGLQKFLADMGKPVWGSRGADMLEINRELFVDALKEVGLEVAPHEVVLGDRLENRLLNAENKYLKVSRWRGDFETFHWRNWQMDHQSLLEFQLQFGPLWNYLRVLVFDAIDTPLEIGGDTYWVDGKTPNIMLNAYEWKDTSYFSAVTKTKDMPQQVLDVLTAFAPVLEREGARNQWSMEIRCLDEHAFFNDATPRGGMPSSASQQLCWKNFPEIVWAAANGECIDPDPDGKFTIECAVTTKHHDGNAWAVAEMPQDNRNFRMSNCCYVDGCYAWPPNPNMGGILGWLAVVGDTPKETMEMAKELCDELPDGFDANIENLVGLIREIEQGEAQGIPFTDLEMPEISEVVEE